MPARLVPLLARSLAVLVAAFALAGCTISSEANLMEGDRAVALLPASFVMYPYQLNATGYVRSSSEPVRYIRDEANVYADEPLTMRIVFAEHPATKDHVIAASAAKADEHETIYGLARRMGNILELRVVLKDGANAAALTGLAGIPGVELKNGGIRLGDRATLDLALTLLDAGKLKSEVFIAYIGDADATLPARIVPSGDWYTTTD